MYIYWWTVLFTMIVAWILCVVVDVFLPCPFNGIRYSMIEFLLGFLSKFNVIDESRSKLRSKSQHLAIHGFRRCANNVRHNNRFNV